VTASNAHLTYKANRGIGRHGWLRLTPAYSVRLVRDRIAALDSGTVVTDPFSGTATTALAAAEHGAHGQAFDINPFLIWLGQAKTRRYKPGELTTVRRRLAAVIEHARELAGAPGLWQPPLANIDRWWSPANLAELTALRAGLDALPEDAARDLLDIAFCRTLITASNAAFNHQSMSFKTPGGSTSDSAGSVGVLASFGAEVADILTSAAKQLPGTARIIWSDSRAFDDFAAHPTTPAPIPVMPCDLLLTSPPYVNRMSYVRELRPYMYWLRYLDEPVDAANLDWAAIGGTWGMATGRLATWRATEDTPITPAIENVCAQIIRDGGKSGPLLANYVRKYFTDMWSHFQSAYKHVKSGGRATYIIGNSTFYGNLVPAEHWYELLLAEAGFGPVSVTVIRKRNSNKQLWEFDVTAHKP
jgi:hypothetical protein